MALSFKHAIIGLIIAAVAGASIFVLRPTPASAGFSECLTAAGLGKVVSIAGKATKVQTQDDVTNIATTGSVAKECVLDGIGLALREALIRKITSSTIEWINSGFEGSPAFVTDVDDFLVDAADEAFGDFIYQDANFAHLCSPWEFDIRFALALSYSQVERPRCTLSDIVDNVETAIDDLSVEWDWEVFQAVTTESGGNPITSFIQVSEDLSNVIESTTGQKVDDLNRGGGFLSFQHCKDANDRYNLYSSQQDLSGFSPEDCEIATPGSIIRQGLSDNLNADLERLTIADEFDEIIGALMGQLFQQALGRDGVRGLSARSGGSTSFIDQYRQDAAGAGQQGAQDLGSAVGSFSENATQYIGLQNTKIQELLAAKIAVSEAYNCYDSKYNTWVDATGTVIDPQNVVNVPEADRARATFLSQVPLQFRGFTYNVLTPETSLAKSQEFKAILDRIDADLLTTESELNQAQQTLALTQNYENRLAATTDVAQTQLIYQEFSNAIGNQNVDPVLAQVSLENIRAYIDQAVNGSITFVGGSQVRQGGATQELATCQSYNQVSIPNLTATTSTTTSP